MLAAFEEEARGARTLDTIASPYRAIRCDKYERMTVVKLWLGRGGDAPAAEFGQEATRNNAADGYRGGGSMGPSVEASCEWVMNLKHAKSR